MTNGRLPDAIESQLKGIAGERMRCCERHFAGVLILLMSACGVRAQELPEWQAGLARVEITPGESLWMAGYASRNKPSEGVAGPLFAKALALQDAAGTRLVIVTLDLIGIPRGLRDAIEVRVQQTYNLPPSSLLLNASHTHSGPVVRSGGSVFYDLTPEQSARIDVWNAGLQNQLVKLVGDAITDLRPARAGYSHSRCGFAMNRRLPTESGFQNSPYPDGPVDHDVPVLRIDAPDGSLRAVVFGYACHNTTLGLYEFCGDYAGFAQQSFEEAHPGTMAMFVLGCGGDQNPYPRGTLELARRHGTTLATAVEAALLPQARPLRGPLKVGLKEVHLEFANPLDMDELLVLKANADPLDQKKAAAMIEDLAATGRIRSDYAYPVQVVRFGQDLTLVALAGETVVDYSLRLKREIPAAPVWVAGYSNDVFGYVPSRRVLEEGGYEGGGAMRYTRLPGPFAANVEELIISTVHDLMQEP